MISEKDLTTLRHASALGAEAAANALTTFIGQDVRVADSELVTLPIDRVAELLGRKEELVTAVLLPVMGDLKGELLYIFSTDGAALATKILEEKYGRPGDQSALQELANIVTGTAFGALESSMGFSATYSAPGIAHDMFGAVTDHTIAGLGAVAEEVLIIQTDFLIEKTVLFETIFLLSSESTTAVAQKLQQISRNGTDH